MNLTDEILQSVERRLKIYKIYDGKGLSIEVPPTGNLRWRYKFIFNKKEKRLSLGIYPAVSIVEARKKRDELKKQQKDGVDPALARKMKKSRTKTDIYTEKIDALELEKERVRSRLQGLEYYVAELRVMIRDLRCDLLPSFKLNNRKIMKYEKEFIKQSQLKNEPIGKQEMAADSLKIADAIYEEFLRILSITCTDDRLEKYSSKDGGLSGVVYNSISISAFKIMFEVWSISPTPLNKLENNVDRLAAGIKVMLRANWDKILEERKEHGIVDSESAEIKA